MGVIMGSRDRTVSSSEADLPEADARLTLPCTHNQLLFAPQVGGAVDRFVRHDRFEVMADLDRVVRQA